MKLRKTSGEPIDIIAGINQEHQSNSNPTKILGTPDDLKLRSGATLFAHLPGAPAEFPQLLAKFYAGHQDQRTIELLDAKCRAEQPR